MCIRDRTITISTHLGDVVGVKKYNGSYFKGIPYGADTSGKNRWRSPQEPEMWSEPFDASLLDLNALNSGWEKGVLEGV